MSDRQSEALTEKQRSILDYLRRHIDEYPYPPSAREILRGCDISSTPVVIICGY